LLKCPVRRLADDSRETWKLTRNPGRVDAEYILRLIELGGVDREEDGYKERDVHLVGLNWPSESMVGA
jgi:hypothetical protein